MSHEPHYAQLHSSFQHSQFLIRRKFWKFFGAELRVFATSGELLLFIKMKAFKLKEDITIFADEAMTTPLVRIRARNIIDISATYDVFDVSTGVEYSLGALRRKGLRSTFIRDEWIILDPNGAEIGMIREDSGMLGVLRRFVDFVALLVPQKYAFEINGNPVGVMEQRLNPFIQKMDADFSIDTQGWLDRRLAATAATLLVVIEGRQR